MNPISNITEKLKAFNSGNGILPMPFILIFILKTFLLFLMNNKRI